MQANGKSAYSDILYVPVGKVALLTLYGFVARSEIVVDDDGVKHLVSNSCADVHKLNLSRVEEKFRDLMCGEFIDVRKKLGQLLLEREVKHEVVYQCGSSWSLNPCNNYALISVPGYYMLEFYDVSQLDDASVEYSLLDVADAVAIPDVFKFGGR